MEPSQIPPAVGPIRRFIGRTFLKLMGWKVSGEMPPHAKCIFIAAPHTSNWDGILMVAVSFVLGIKVSWMVKHTMLKPPIGWLVRATGGMAIDRSQSGDRVQQIAQSFRDADKLILVIAPSGTRDRRDTWKSGFYHIAHAAQIPIVYGFLDFKRKVGGVGGVLHTTGDLKADMDAIRVFYDNVNARYPEKVSTIKLRGESTENTPA